MPGSKTTAVWIVATAVGVMAVAGGIAAAVLLSRRGSSDVVVERITMPVGEAGFDAPSGTVELEFRGKKGSAVASVTWPAMTYTQSAVGPWPDAWNPFAPFNTAAANFPGKWLPRIAKATATDQSWSITNPGIKLGRVPAIMITRWGTNGENANVALAPLDPVTEATYGFGSPVEGEPGFLVVNTPMTCPYYLETPL